MATPIPFLKELESRVREDSEQELFEWMAGSIHSFFATPEIPRYYQLVKQVEISRCQQAMPRLMIGWMALLSGDHARLFQVMDLIREEDLATPAEQSFYHALKALIGYMLDPEAGLLDARKSLEILQNQPMDIFKANAQLTVGQLLASTHQYREAATAFNTSEKAFRSLKLPFLSAVALMNQMLNRYQLGEFHWVMERCRQVLLQSGSFQEERQDFWKLIHLPLGMCYYQMNKPHAALRYLISSRECINATALFHLRGLSEQFLFRVYHLLDDREAMTDIYQKAKQQVEHMHYEKHKGFQLLCGVTLATVGTQKEIQPELEQAELVFQQQGVHCSPLILEALTLATLGRLTRSVTAKSLEESLKHLRYIGRIAQMQLVLVHLATQYHQEDQSDKSQKALKEALQLYRDHGCCAAFSHMNSEMQQILFQADPTAARQMHLPHSVKGSTSKRNVHPALLTIREKEVVQLMADGKTNAEISTILFISVGTIKWHINHIFSKLEASNRVQAIQKARQAGEI